MSKVIEVEPSYATTWESGKNVFRLTLTPTDDGRWRVMAEQRKNGRPTSYTAYASAVDLRSHLKDLITYLDGVIGDIDEN